MDTTISYQAQANTAGAVSHAAPLVTLQLTASSYPDKLAKANPATTVRHLVPAWWAGCLAPPALHSQLCAGCWLLAGMTGWPASTAAISASTSASVTEPCTCRGGGAHSGAAWVKICTPGWNRVE